ncbi:MAG: hypothetical protein F6K24_39980 [Okeania sp. SIO2D1]|nr:hypothetical protein [Okeania sp. SIO2D1]
MNILYETEFLIIQKFQKLQRCSLGSDPSYQIRGDGEMRRWGDGEMGRWGDGDLPLTPPRRGEIFGNG